MVWSATMAPQVNRPTATGQLQAQVAELKQQILHPRQELEERTDELDAARAANRDLLTLANSMSPARRSAAQPSHTMTADQVPPKLGKR